jgi:hypothetical protein
LLQTGSIGTKCRNIHKTIICVLFQICSNVYNLNKLNVFLLQTSSDDTTCHNIHNTIIYVLFQICNVNNCNYKSVASTQHVTTYIKRLFVSCFRSAASGVWCTMFFIYMTYTLLALHLQECVVSGLLLAVTQLVTIQSNFLSLYIDS